MEFPPRVRASSTAPSTGTNAEFAAGVDFSIGIRVSLLEELMTAVNCRVPHPSLLRRAGGFVEDRNAKFERPVLFSNASSSAFPTQLENKSLTESRSMSFPAQPRQPTSRRVHPS